MDRKPTSSAEEMRKRNRDECARIQEALRVDAEGIFQLQCKRASLETDLSRAEKRNDIGTMDSIRANLDTIRTLITEREAKRKEMLDRYHEIFREGKSLVHDLQADELREETLKREREADTLLDEIQASRAKRAFVQPEPVRPSRISIPKTIVISGSAGCAVSAVAFIAGAPAILALGVCGAATAAATAAILFARRRKKSLVAEGLQYNPVRAVEMLTQLRRASFNEPGEVQQAIFSVIGHAKERLKRDPSARCSAYVIRYAESLRDVFIKFSQLPSTSPIRNAIRQDLLATIKHWDEDMMQAVQVEEKGVETILSVEMKALKSALNMEVR